MGGSMSLNTLFAAREAQLRAAFLTATSPEDMVLAMDVLREKAFIKKDLDALRVYLAYTLGSAAKAQRMLPHMNLPSSATLSECGDAIEVVLEAMSTGVLSQEEAEAYVHVIDKRASILRAALVIDEDPGDGNRPITVIIQPRAETHKS